MAKNILRGLSYILLLFFAAFASFLAVRLAWIHFYKAAYPLGYKDIVLEQSELTGVSPALLFAVIRTESGFNPNAQSSVPARGLMQITQVTFDWIGFRLGEEGKYDYDDMFNSDVNIRYGAELMRFHLAEFGSDTNALCAYHAGRSRVLQWLQNPEYSQNGEIIHIPFRDTRAHVAKALQAKNIYEKLYPTALESD